MYGYNVDVLFIYSIWISMLKTPVEPNSSVVTLPRTIFMKQYYPSVPVFSDTETLTVKNYEGSITTPEFTRPHPLTR